MTVSGPVTNWAGNVRFAARRRWAPGNLDELRRLVARSDRIRAVGSGHSFSPVADTDGDLVSLSALPVTIDVDPERRTVRVAGEVRYADLTPRLHEAGFALPNLGSLPHIAVVGACMTGTHGSGSGNRALADAVSSVEMVTAGGDLVQLERGSADFDGAVVALGCLGIVTAVTLDVVPTFSVQQRVHVNLDFEQALGHLNELLDSAYAVSLFTRWRKPRFDQVWLKRRADDTGPSPTDLYGAPAATRALHPVAGLSPAACTPQLDEPGPWHERLPHFRASFVPSAGDELQSEYLLPRDRAVDALRALDGIREVIAPVLHVSEIRTVAADDLWLSPCHGRDTLAIHFTWHHDAQAVAPAVAAVEDRLAAYAPRPHWGKVFALAPEAVRATYERADDFGRLRSAYDPDGTFGNAFVDRYLPAAAS